MSNYNFVGTSCKLNQMGYVLLRAKVIIIIVIITILVTLLSTVIVKSRNWTKGILVIEFSLQ